MKKFHCLLLMIALFVLTACPISASTQEIRVRIDGEYVNFDVKPFIEKGRTLVPFRAIFEKLGASVEWVPANDAVIATKTGLEIRLKLNSTTAFVNGMPTTLDVAPRAVQGRTFVPLRFVSEKFGLNVEWDAATNEVIIVTPKAPSTPFIGEHAELHRALASAESFRGQINIKMATVVDVNGKVVDGNRSEYSGKVYGKNVHVEGKVSALDPNSQSSMSAEMIIYDGVHYMRENGTWKVVNEVPFLSIALDTKLLLDGNATIINKGASFINGLQCTMYEVKPAPNYANTVSGLDYVVNEYDFLMVSIYVDSSGKLVHKTVTAMDENSWELAARSL